MLTGIESVTDAAKSGQPVIVTCKPNVSKVRKLIKKIKSDGRCTIRDIYKAAGKSLFISF